MKLTREEKGPSEAGGQVVNLLGFYTSMKIRTWGAIGSGYRLWMLPKAVSLSRTLCCGGHKGVQPCHMSRSEQDVFLQAPPRKNGVYDRRSVGSGSAVSIKAWEWRKAVPGV